MPTSNVKSSQDACVVVAIVSTDEANNLIGCLKSLVNSIHRNFRVIICENGGQIAYKRDAEAFTREGFRECSSVDDIGNVLWSGAQRNFRFAPDLWATVLCTSVNLGYAGGVNACIRAAATDWDAIWVLNPDTFPEPAALSSLIDHQRTGNYGIVGSRLVFVSNGRIQTMGGAEWIAWLSRARNIGLMAAQDITTIPAQVENLMGFVSGASMYVTRAYVNQVGLMDEDFFVFCEDVDWCLRRGRFKLGYAHDSIVHHVHGSTSGSSLNKGKRSRFNIYLEERNKMLLARKRYRRFWMLLAFLNLVQMIEYLARREPFAQLAIALDGWWAGVKGCTGAPYFLQPRQS